MIKDGHLIIEAIEKSNAWDNYYRIPSVPMHRNPHTYLAYMTKLVSRYPVANMIYRETIFKDIISYILVCEGPDGYIKRRPSDDDTSHDEMMFASYHSANFANRCVEFVSKNDGIVEKNTNDEKQNAYRFLFFRAVIRACSTKYRVGLISQAAYCVHLIYSILKTRRAVKQNKYAESSGILKIWCANDRMNSYLLCSFFIDFWKWYHVKNGYTAKMLFSKLHLVECPIFAKLAMEDLD